jgi:hypothetical protein
MRVAVVCASVVVMVNGCVIRAAAFIAVPLLLYHSVLLDHWIV